MGRSSRKLSRFADLSTVALAVCLFGSAQAASGSVQAAEVLNLHQAGAVTNLDHRKGWDHSTLSRSARERPPLRIIRGRPLIGRAPASDLAYAGLDLGSDLDRDGVVGGFSGFDTGALPPSPQPFAGGPLDQPFGPPLQPMAALPPPPFLALPAQPPACPLIIAIGRGLRHAIRSRVVSGRAYCR